MATIDARVCFGDERGLICGGEKDLTCQMASVHSLVPVQPEGLEVRISRDPVEVAAAQQLRYRVFYEEMGARACARTRATGLDVDPFDEVCDHLLVLADNEVVGTYRLVRRDAARHVGSFYSAAEFDIAPLQAHGGEILELGRSCIDARWRSRGAVQLLWQGIASYIVQNRIELLFGCASLPGTDVAALAPQLAYLRDHHLAPEILRTRPLGPNAIALDGLPAVFDARRAFLSLPPLVKGYLRAGAMISDGAVMDHQFNTTDVLMVLNTADIASRYQRRYAQG